MIQFYKPRYFAESKQEIRKPPGMIVGPSNVQTARLRALKLLRKNGEQRLASYEFAKELALVFRDYVNLSKCKDVRDLVSLIQIEGDYLISLYPTEFILRNTLYMITKFIREETQRLAFDEEHKLTSFDSLKQLWAKPENSVLKVGMKELKKAVMGSVEEYALDIDSLSDEIAEKACKHLTTSDKVMTFRYSDSSTLQTFLKGVRCTVLSVDDVECTEPKKLPYIATQLVDVVIKMEIVTRVVLSAIAVLPDGSCVMQAGTRMICEIAKLRSLPIIVCSAYYKFTPILPSLIEYNRHAATGKILGVDFELLSAPNLRVSNPLFDHIPAELVSFYVTQDLSELVPSKVYDVLTDNYHPADLYCFED